MFTLGVTVATVYAIMFTPFQVVIKLHTNRVIFTVVTLSTVQQYMVKFFCRDVSIFIKKNK